MITRLQHVGLVVNDLEATLKNYEKLFGMKAYQIRRDQGKGFQYDARLMFPNEVWLHIVQNWNPESRVNQFLQKHGEGLEHIALESNNIEDDVNHLRKLGVPVYEDTIFDAADGYEAFVYPEDGIGFTVELIQPHTTSWIYNQGELSNRGLLGLQHVGVAVRDVAAASEKFNKLFRIEGSNLRTDQHYGTQKDMMIEPGNDRLWLHLVESTDPENRVTQFMDKHGEGLEHLCIEFDDIRDVVKSVQAADVPLFKNKIFLDREDGFEAFVYPEYNHGVTIELIEPYVSSRGYRPQLDI
ncbi:MAG: VOC family protein [Anaerolineaceae bacterium]|nr:VOC family protein [Anaerolineaceae bacterium]